MTNPYQIYEESVIDTVFFYFSTLFFFYCYLSKNAIKPQYENRTIKDRDGCSYCLFPENKTAIFCNLTKNVVDLSIPPKIIFDSIEYTVTGLDHIETYRSHLQLGGIINGSLYIPSTITFIGDYFFSGQQITSLTFEPVSDLRFLGSNSFSSISTFF